MATVFFQKSHAIPQEATADIDGSPWYLRGNYFFMIERGIDEPPKNGLL